MWRAISPPLQGGVFPMMLVAWWLDFIQLNCYSRKFILGQWLIKISKPQAVLIMYNLISLELRPGDKTKSGIEPHHTQTQRHSEKSLFFYYRNFQKLISRLEAKECQVRIGGKFALLPCCEAWKDTWKEISVDSGLVSIYWVPRYGSKSTSFHIDFLTEVFRI